MSRHMRVNWVTLLLPISDFADLNSYLVFHTSAGQTIELTLLRDGQSLVLPLTLGEQP